ncbi:hypothetical protein ES703_94496 [subsurface metagenome]
MPPEDDLVEVLVVKHETAGGAVSEATPVEMGAQGKLVELIAIHYAVEYLGLPNVTWIVNMGLSSNPNHLLNPPISRAHFLGDSSIYGAFSHTFTMLIAGATYALGHWLDLQVVPLHGLIRPRRQIFVIRVDTPVATRVRLEIYYRPIAIKGIIKSTIDRKFGKYRRS